MTYFTFSTLCRRTFLAILVLSFSPLSAAPGDAAEVTPAEWLRAQPKPKFRAGHTLPRLTRFAWDMDDDVRVALVEDWGYALEFGVADVERVERAINGPKSREGKLLALAISDPKRYPLYITTSRELPKSPVPEVWTRDAQGKFVAENEVSLEETEWNPKLKTVLSPMAPDSFWQEAGELSAAPIRKLRAKCPIAIVLNTGEYNLGVAGFWKPVWEKDPAIMKAKGERPWLDFISERKAHGQGIITKAERDAAPDRQLYIYYTAGGGTHRSINVDDVWSYSWAAFKGVSDLPSNESYFSHINSGWTGPQDMLTMILNAASLEIADGRPLSYNWLSGGWEGEPGHSHGDIVRWRGFLKCDYTAGMIGGNTGYYQYLGRDGFSQPFAADRPPHWLQQLTTVAQVHAAFTHLEDFLRDGDLLPGPAKHRISKDSPAFEFPTGDKNVRVLARKHRQRAEWLITAWVADGDAREVTVQIPELGEVRLRARPDGAVYLASIGDGGNLVKDTGL